MPYCIFAITKLTTPGKIAAAEGHTERTRETLNADPAQQNLVLCGQETQATPLAQLVHDRIGDNNGRTVRKDAVLCVELLLSASPEFFRPDCPEKAGFWLDDRLSQWSHLNQDWLKQSFGDRLVRATLHLDEATPHIHAYVVPISEQGYLSCKQMFGGSAKLSQWQTHYGQAMQPLELERGIQGSQATHTRMKQFYAAVNQPRDADLTLEQMYDQIADRHRVLKERDELEQTAKVLGQKRDELARQLQEQQQRLAELEHKHQAAIRQNRRYRAFEQRVKQEAPKLFERLQQAQGMEQ